MVKNLIFTGWASQIAFKVNQVQNMAHNFVAVATLEIWDLHLNIESSATCQCLCAPLLSTMKLTLCLLNSIWSLNPVSAVDSTKGCFSFTTDSEVYKKSIKTQITVRHQYAICSVNNLMKITAFSGNPSEVRS